MTETETTPPTCLERQQNGAIVRLRLNRPERRNALSSGMLSALHSAITEIGNDSSVHVVIIAAEGSVFCAGHDLTELTAHRADRDGGQGFFRKLFRQCSDLMLAITACPKPVIAEVQGMATAAGCQLVATCDLAVAGESARFATPGVHIGLFCSTPMVAVSRAVGRKRALEMLFTGEALSAREAEACGLVNRVVDDTRLSETVTELATKIADKSPLAIATGKRAFYRQIDLDLAAAYDHASEVMACNMLADDAGEGIDAFLSKRTPHWTGT